MRDLHFSLDSLPPHLRAQADRQLGGAPKAAPEPPSKPRAFAIPGSTAPEGLQKPLRRRGGVFKTNALSTPKDASQSLLGPSPAGYSTIAEVRAENKAKKRRKTLTPDMAKTLVKSCEVSPDGDEVKMTLGVDPAMLATAQQKGVYVGKDNQVHFFTKAKIANAQKALKISLSPFSSHCSQWGKVPISLSVDFCFPFQKATSKKNIADYAYHIQRPDADNIFKGIGDAMTEAGFWEDDSVISDLHLRKFRVVGDPYIKITIRRLPTGLFVLNLI